MKRNHKVFSRVFVWMMLFGIGAWAISLIQLCHRIDGPLGGTVTFTQVLEKPVTMARKSKSVDEPVFDLPMTETFFQMPASQYGLDLFAGGEDVLRIEENGDIYYKGRKIKSDRDVYVALCKALRVEPKP